MKDQLLGGFRMRCRAYFLFIIALFALMLGACTTSSGGGGGGDDDDNDDAGVAGDRSIDRATGNDTNVSTPDTTTTPDTTGTPETTGLPDLATEECGDVTLQGECDGSQLSYCYQDALVSYDCVEAFAEMGATGACQLIDGEGEDDYGYDCAVSIGDGCVYSGDSGLWVAFCNVDASDPGCLIGEEDATCVEDLGTCESTYPDPYPPECSGDYLIAGCNVNQPYAYECAVGSEGSCDAASATCIDRPAGSYCDSYTGATDSVFFCADGLSCEGNATDGYLCVAE